MRQIENVTVYTGFQYDYEGGTGNPQRNSRLKWHTKNKKYEELNRKQRRL